MATEGFEAVFVETHHWGKSATFFQELGYDGRLWSLQAPAKS
ncbi:hypothetical protein [Streptomyces sp. NBC_00448]